MKVAACALQAVSFCDIVINDTRTEISKVRMAFSMKKKNSQNYLDYIPVRNPEVEYETSENGKVTLYIEWKGFYHKIAQKFFHRPRVSDIKMDDYGSFVWLSIDDVKDVHQLSKELDQKYPKMEKSLSRLIKFLEILRDNHLIHWKGEKQK